VSLHSPQNPAPKEADVVPEAAAARLFARAGELEAAGKTGFNVADLRAAATEAGIPLQAFEAALAEWRSKQPHSVSAPAPAGRRSLRRLRGGWAVAGVGAAALLLALGLRLTSAAPAATTFTEALMLRCLAPGEAAELVRPLLRDRSSTVEYNEARAPRVLTIRGTSDVLQQAKAVLAEHEGAAPACASTPVSPVARALP
jgi:hypothetical protein